MGEGGANNSAVVYPINTQIITRHNALGRGTGFGAGAAGDPAYTLQAGHEHGVVYALQANGIDRADTAGCNGAGWREGQSYTLNTIDKHAVVYPAVSIEPGLAARKGGHSYEGVSGTLRANPGDNQMAVVYPAVTGSLCASGAGTMRPAGQANEADMCVVQTYTMQRSDEYTETNAASTQSARQYKSATDLVVTRNRKYVIRRLTPTECARLQGFPDDWGSLAPYDGDTAFWEGVRKTHAEINGKAYKPMKDLKKWYEGLHTDRAEYKMWGNGIALPCAVFVLGGIARIGEQR